MEGTAKDLKIGHEYVFVSSELDQEKILVYHGTLIQSYDGGTNGISAEFKLKEFAGETYDTVHASFYFNKVIGSLESLGKPFKLEAFISDSNDRKTAKIYKAFHRMKDWLCGTKPSGEKYYVPLQFIIGDGFDDAVKVLDTFFKNTLSEQKRKMEMEMEMYEQYKISFPEQIMTLRSMK